jgi:hypothetical protein
MLRQTHKRGAVMLFDHLGPRGTATGEVMLGLPRYSLSLSGCSLGGER